MDENRLRPEDRYHRDVHFKALVDTIRVLIEQAEYTPSEVREAAILACTHHEIYSMRARRIPAHFSERV